MNLYNLKVVLVGLVALVAIFVWLVKNYALLLGLGIISIIVMSFSYLIADEAGWLK
jgi:hypothetical protein